MGLEQLVEAFACEQSSRRAPRSCPVRSRPKNARAWWFCGTPAATISSGRGPRVRAQPLRSDPCPVSFRRAGAGGWRLPRRGRAPAPPFPGGGLVDLSHAYDAQAIFWPTAEPFRLEKVADGITPAGYYYAANDFFTLRARRHARRRADPLRAGPPTVDRIPLERLMGAGGRRRRERRGGEERDYQVTADDLQRARRATAASRIGAILLIRTGFAQRWPDAATYLGTAERGGRRSRSSTSPAFTRTRPPGSSPTDRSPRSASTRRASTTASRRCSSPTGRCSRRTSRPSRTSPSSIGCRRAAPTSSRCR